ncbi:MAG: hypothetical protein QM817_29250 [Archangium sp.]
MTRTVSLLVVCLLSAALLEGCRKKRWDTYYTLDAQQQIAIARDGDDAYVSDEMNGLIASLRGAPADSKEYAQAIALADKLAAEQQRVQSEIDAKKKVVVAAPPNPVAPPFPTVAAPAPPPTPASDVDAGPEEPFFGMSEADFLKAFGSCFSKGPDTTGPDGGAASSQLAKNEPACARFNTPNAETSYVFLKASGLWGSVTKTAPRVEKVNTPPAPPQAVAAADAGERILTIPGAPVREGYRRETETADGGY